MLVLDAGFRFWLDAGFRFWLDAGFRFWLDAGLDAGFGCWFWMLVLDAGFGCWFWMLVLDSGWMLVLDAYSAWALLPNFYEDSNMNEILKYDIKYIYIKN